MVLLGDILKIARTCHSKRGWEGFFETYHTAITEAKDPKLIAGLFRLLQQDPLALTYSPRIFATLVDLCRATYSFEIGKDICRFAERLSNPLFTLTASQLLIESGDCSSARSFIHRSLRLTKLSDVQRIALTLALATSYAEENKHAKALLYIPRIEEALRRPSLGLEEEARLYASLGRLLLSLGRSAEASHHLLKAASLFENHKLWAELAEALIYGAASVHLHAGENGHLSKSLLERARLLVTTHGLTPLQALLEEQAGEQLSSQGRFSEAQQRYRSAIDLHYKSPNNYRRTIVMIKIVICQLASGRTSSAFKQGRLIFDQGKHLKNARFISYRVHLEALLAWENEQVKTSQRVLERYLRTLGPGPLGRHHDAELLAIYLFQAATLGQQKINSSIPQQLSLPAGSYAVVLYTIAKGLFALNQGSYPKAEGLLKQAYEVALEHRYSFLQALALDGLIQHKLAQQQLDTELLRRMDSFHEILAEFDSLLLRPLYEIALAGAAYQGGEFAIAVRYLKEASRLRTAPPLYRFALSSWLKTIEGKSPRAIKEPLLTALARLSRHYFSPTLVVTSPQTYLVSRHYPVSLTNHASLQALMTHMLHQPHFEASPADLQRMVWHQSLHTAGWQHKIRNSFIRLRGLFRFTMAPLFIRNRTITLFNQAITIQVPRTSLDKREEEISSLLAKAPLSSKQIGQHLALSRAGTKRILAKLVKKGVIEKQRRGRNYHYALIEK